MAFMRSHGASSTFSRMIIAGRYFFAYWSIALNVLPEELVWMEVALDVSLLVRNDLRVLNVHRRLSSRG